MDERENIFPDGHHRRLVSSLEAELVVRALSPPSPGSREGGFSDGSSSEGCLVARRPLLFGFRAGARMRALIGIDGSSTSEAASVRLDALCGREGATC
jgi:hypothetical protein